MDGRSEEIEEESVDISMTVGQASSIYIITNQHESILINQITKLREEPSEENRELIEFLTIVLNDTKWLKSETAQIVKELNPDEDKSSIIAPPNWRKG
jgi:hypothetical protein